MGQEAPVSKVYTLTEHPVGSGNGVFYKYEYGKGPLRTVAPSPIYGGPATDGNYELRVVGHFVWTNTTYNVEHLADNALLAVCEEWFAENAGVPKETLGCDLRTTSYLPHLCCLDFYHLSPKLRVQRSAPARPDLRGEGPGGWHPARQCPSCGSTGGHKDNCIRGFLEVNADTRTWEVGQVTTFDTWGDVIPIDSRSDMTDVHRYLTESLQRRAELAGLNPVLFVDGNRTPTAAERGTVFSARADARALQRARNNLNLARARRDPARTIEEWQREVEWLEQLIADRGLSPRR